MRLFVLAAALAATTSVFAQSPAPLPTLSPAPLPNLSPAPVAAPKPLDSSRFKPITNADLDKMPSGCSFSAMRGKDLIAISLNEDETPADTKAGRSFFWFKVDGKLTKFTGKTGKKDKDQHIGSWTGKIAGHDVTVIEGKRDPKFKNDGGGQGGAGSIEWKAGEAKGTLPIKWEAGC